jgi:hypothetical protein
VDKAAGSPALATRSATTQRFERSKSAEAAQLKYRAERKIYTDTLRAQQLLNEEHVDSDGHNEEYFSNIDDPDYEIDEDADDNDDDDGKDDNEGGVKRSVGSRKGKTTKDLLMNTMPGRGLIYPEDNADLVNLFDEDYEEKNFTLIPSEAPFDRSRKRILGGPQRPITSHMSSSKAKEAQQNYQSKRKAYTDKKRQNLIHELSAVDVSSLPGKIADATEYTGDQYPHIRLMEIVNWSPLLAGHTFQHKETLQIRVAEKANLCNIKIKVLKSCKVNYEAAGDNFYIKASCLLYEGWKVHVCIAGIMMTLYKSPRG